MNTLFGDRFKSARLLNGLSLQDVANKLSRSVTRQAIYRYEKGEVMPDSEVLGELCKLFNVKPDFFFRDVGVEIGEVEYRKLNLPAKEEIKIKEQTKDYLSRYLEIEDILGVNVEFENPLKDYPAVSNYEHVNNAANLLRESWNLGKNAIPNIAELLEDKHVKVVKLDAVGEFDGLQTYANKNIPVIAYNVNKHDKKDRIRFTLLHELGHLLLKFDKNLTHGQVEKLCHQFAGAMLLPENALKIELGEHRKRLSIIELGNIKKQYGISMQAIVMRANACGIVNDNYKRQFFNMMDENNWRVNEPIDYEGNEVSGRFDQLIFRALVEDLISFSKAAALKNMSLAELKSQTQLI